MGFTWYTVDYNVSPGKTNSEIFGIIPGNY
jgi:hypothetical protein